MKQSTEKHEAATLEASIQEAPPEPAIRILKNATCQTLSGKSTLGYQVGLTDGAETVSESTILVRLVANSGGGFINQDWVSLEAIHALLRRWGVGKSVTSTVLYPLFRGKSSNTPAFLMAALKSAGVIELVSLKPRIYKKGDPAAFMAEMAALHVAGVDLADTPAQTKPAQAKPGKSKAVKPPKGPAGKAQSKVQVKAAKPS